MSEWIGIHDELPQEYKVVECVAIDSSGDGDYYNTAGILDDGMFFVFNEEGERTLEAREVVSWRYLSDA